MNKRFILVAAALCVALGVFWFFQLNGEDAGNRRENASAEKAAAAKNVTEETVTEAGEQKPAVAEERTKAEAKRLWRVVATEGTALDQESVAFATARLQGRVPVGRTMVLDQRGLLELAQLKQGDQVSILLPGGEVSGLVNLVQTTAEGTVRVGGGLGLGVCVLM